ncbi:response regulator transcription factor [Sedimentitalea nanhaiensis]|uniref:DNA-binding response regulator, OmpR family, contains REC and winged-helix (WHTH) domain n=1 Tax=Sedimentitalea nanhaiensis TaxID=999627 RepID=A0A1I7E6U2_9RHOB|nr:response regulator transcription factor [Sedimentitalea nanhaiensis]SFU19640.1 DNA-binding response regulator, OmpR family, contains REC and winged-helix (wHTH) domain [Sedimentitalea nanhaiensis]
MTTRLLIIEDDPEIASALIRGLALYGYDAEAENRADRGLARLMGEDFSGAVVDVMLGADSGIELVRRARAAGMSGPILMLSALSDVDHRAAGLEAGADDYVVKPFLFDELVARLRVQERRADAQHPEPARLSRANRTLSAYSGEVTLTEREFEVLDLLVRHAGTPLPRGEIFDALWMRGGTGHENVVDVYVGYLRKKLSSLDCGFEIKTLRNKGFVLDGRPPEILTD